MEAGDFLWPMESEFAESTEYKLRTAVGGGRGVGRSTCSQQDLGRRRVPASGEGILGQGEELSGESIMAAEACGPGESGSSDWNAPSPVPFFQAPSEISGR